MGSRERTGEASSRLHLSPNARRTLGRREPGRQRNWSWAALRRRAFGLDVLACPRCGARLRVVATIEDPVVVRRVLASLGVPCPAETPGPGPPAAVPAWAH
jgi:hypothetical protein